MNRQRKALLAAREWVHEEAEWPAGGHIKPDRVAARNLIELIDAALAEPCDEYHALLERVARLHSDKKVGRDARALLEGENDGPT